LAEHANRFFVLTGGPGSGKSTLIEALQRAGYAATVEAGRGIIQDQTAIAGRALPWQDALLFAEMMLSWEMRSYHIAEQCNGPVFFDRGVVDVAGYLRVVGLPIPAHISQAAMKFRYNPRVFIAPPWKEIYGQDTERKQQFDEARRTYDAMLAAYTECGYELIQLPKAPVDERLRLILATVRPAMT
jgi:predicted ATPase